MNRKQLLLLSIVFALMIPSVSHAQAWSGILNPSRAIDWSTAGIPGGIPSRTTACATLNASTYGNGSSDATSAINSELSRCSSGQYVSLSAGTFLINGNVHVPSNVTLRGAGANQTILQAHNSGAVISLGTGSVTFGQTNAIPIVGGTSAGSTSITLASASGVSVGSYLVIDQLNDGVIVSSAGSEGSCTWCDNGQGGTRVQGQIVEVKSVSGSTVGISPGLYVAYARTPHATPFTATKYAGVENLQVYANNTGATPNFAMSLCAYCWISGVEGNYTDGDHVEADFSYHSEIINSYFSNAYLHTPGTTDSDLALRNKSTGMLVQNNIFERLHLSATMEWGPAGNVIAYNYMFGNFDVNAPNVMISNLNTHGAHPQFNLWEGNIATQIHPDSIWGSTGTLTTFRNWATGGTKICNPLSGRGTVTCSPMGAQGAPGVNGWYAVQGVRAMDFDFLVSNPNMVGDVIGSSTMAALTYYNDGSRLLTQVPLVVAVCGPSPCGSGSRAYDTTANGFSLGYGEASDSGGSTYDSLTPYNTMFQHGEFDLLTGLLAWVSGVTQTLPASFYLTSKPAWFGSMPFPAIGPDVTGGAFVSGHANNIPAKACYEGVMGGSDGSGSPLPFNADACYGSSQSSTGAPAPPTGITISVQ